MRDTCREIGFVSDAVGLDADNCKVLMNIEAQSPDIAQGGCPLTWISSEVATRGSRRLLLMGILVAMTQISHGRLLSPSNGRRQLPRIFYLVHI